MSMERNGTDTDKPSTETINCIEETKSPKDNTLSVEKTTLKNNTQHKTALTAVALPPSH